MATMTITASLTRDVYLGWVPIDKGLVTVRYPGNEPKYIFLHQEDRYEKSKFIRDSFQKKQEEINKAEQEGYSASAGPISDFLNGNIDTLVMLKK